MNSLHKISNYTDVCQQFRLVTSLSVEGAAFELGIPVSEYCDIEAGRTVPPAYFVQAIQYIIINYAASNIARAMTAQCYVAKKETH